jgi:hypothetical protein
MGREVMTMEATGPPLTASVLLFWLPLGAGGRSVRWNGRVYEACVARFEGRPIQDLYHSALEVRIGRDRVVIEMAPVWATREADRGVTREGPVGSRWLGRFTAFRYEVRRWHMGIIPDVAEAVASPQLVGRDLARAQRLLELVPQVPAATWGRDELRTGEMWNSNSLIAWLLARSGHGTAGISPPGNGRAPGWRAGLILAAREARQDSWLQLAAGLPSGGATGSCPEPAAAIGSSRNGGH